MRYHHQDARSANAQNARLAREIQECDADARHYMRIVSLDLHYRAKGLRFLCLTTDTHTGEEYVTVERPTTIPKVPNTQQ